MVMHHPVSPTEQPPPEDFNRRRTRSCQVVTRKNKLHLSQNSIYVDMLDGYLVLLEALLIVEVALR